MKDLEASLTNQFVCPRCGQSAARVKTLAMSGKGITRFMDLQPYKFLFVTCRNCGYTEVYDPKVLNQTEDPEHVLQAIFARRRAE